MDQVIAAVTNITTGQKQAIANTLPETQQYREDWRRSLNATLKEGVSRSLEFLLANGPTDNVELQRQLIQVVQRYSRNKRITVQELCPPPSIERLRTTIDEQLGLSLLQHQHEQTQIRAEYLATVKRLNAAESDLRDRLARLENTHELIVKLQSLESTVDLDQLQEPVSRYLTGVFDCINLGEAYKRVLTEYGRFLILQESLDCSKPQNLPTCTICSDLPVTHALTPCGHTFCEGCCTHQTTSCYICRTQIRDRMRLYFS